MIVTDIPQEGSETASRSLPPKSSNTPLATRILTTAEELSGLRPAWEAIVNDNNSTANRPFFSWEWFEASAKAFAGGRGIRYPGSRYVVVLEEQGQGHPRAPCTHGRRVVGILPLLRQKTRQYGMTIYELAFCPNSNTPRNQLLVAAGQCEREAARATLAALLADRRSWHILRLDNIPQDSALSNLLGEAEQARTGLVIRTEGRRSPCIGIGDFPTFDGYFNATVKKHYRTKLRRDLKRLDETGQDWGVEYFETPEEVARGLEGLLEVRRASWKGAPEEGFVQFFREISPLLAQRREVLITLLRVGGRPVAAQYIVRREGEYCMILNDHDHQCHDSMAPGNNLLTLVLQEAFQRGWKVLDFSGEDYEYKKRLATATRVHDKFQVFNPGLKSRAVYFGKTRVLPLLRKMLRKNQPVAGENGE